MQATALMAALPEDPRPEPGGLERRGTRADPRWNRARSRCGAPARLFDLLVREGGFDPTILSLLIDTQLQKHMDARHGAALSRCPKHWTIPTPMIVVVMSRMFADEIAAEIRTRTPRAEIHSVCRPAGKRQDAQSRLKGHL